MLRNQLRTDAPSPSSSASHLLLSALVGGVVSIFVWESVRLRTLDDVDPLFQPFV